jgi:hypothetical protein
MGLVGIHTGVTVQQKGNICNILQGTERREPEQGKKGD